MPRKAADRIASCLQLSEHYYDIPASITGGKDEWGIRSAYSYGELLAYQDADGRGVWVRASTDSTQTTNHHIRASYDACHAAGLKFSRHRAQRGGRPFRLMYTHAAMIAEYDAETRQSAELAATAGGAAKP